jgi:hypothetical protein
MPERLECVLVKGKETTNTVVYDNRESEDATFTRNVYVEAWAAKKLGHPTKVRVTIEAVES